MNSQIAVELLTKENFIAWLKSKEPEEIVGEESRCLSCPIANFFRQVYGVEVKIGHMFSGSDIQVIGDTEWVALPEWASDFITYVDESEVSIAVYLSKEAAETLEENSEYTDYEKCLESDPFAFFDSEWADTVGGPKGAWIRAYTFKPSAGGCLKVMEALET